MDEHREQTPHIVTPASGASAVPPFPTAEGVAPAYSSPTPAAPARTANPFVVALRILRLLLLRVLNGLLGIGRVLRPHVGWLMVIVLLVGVIAVQAFLLIAPQIFRADTSDNRVALLTPPQAVLSFLEGQSTYNADLIWEAFSPELQANLSERGASKELIAAQVEDERLAGRRYRTISYIGGIQLGERSRYYYVVDIDSPQPDQAGSFSFIFTVNRDGKIIGIQRE